MSLSTPLDKMTVEQLEARIRFHESTSALYEEYREPIMAQTFEEMADVYRKELVERFSRK
jgi:hypothetical protein